MSDISQETHQALLDKAVRDAVSATEAALAAKVEEVATLSTQVEEQSTKIDTLTADNTRLNTELDSAQIAKKAAEDKAAKLETDLAAKDAAAAKAEVASKRTDQVKNLKLFTDEYVQERASAWADLAEEAWTERLDEWKTLKPAETGTPAADSASASAMTGTTGNLTSTATGTEGDKPKSAKRAALGLVN